MRIQLERVRGTDADVRTAISTVEAPTVFSPLPHGEYAVTVGDEGPDNERHRNPCEQQIAGSSGYFIAAPRSRAIQLTSGDTSQSAEFRAHRASRLQGLVDGPRGEVDRCQILLWSLDDSRSWDTISDEVSGEFCIVLPPGQYLVRAHPERTFDGHSYESHPLEDLTRPAPIVVGLQGGEAKSIVLAFGQGGAAISGRAVDQLGEPWGGLEVRAFVIANSETGPIGSQFTTTIAKSRTDDGGNFLIGLLPTGRYGLAFRLPEQIVAGPGGLGEYPETIEVDIGLESTGVDLGTCLVYRWTPLRVEGRVAIEGNAPGQFARAFALLPSLKGEEKPRRRPLQIGEDGAFEFEVSSHKSAYLELEVEGERGTRRYRREIVPLSGETLLFYIKYP